MARSGSTAMSNLAPVLPIESRNRSLSATVRTATAWVEKIAASRPVVLIGFTILYLIPTIFLSRIKLFWDDEFFTLYLSRTADWKTLLQALATGADQHPPSFYYLTHWIMQILGTGHVTVRLPAIVGFWIMCVCLYEIVRSLATPTWAVVAMLFPLTTPLYYYSMEARAYGLVLGFSALALLSWFRASSFRSRKVYLPLLAFGLAAAVASHYYAAMVAVCLGLGELVRTFSRRKIDWPIWIAMAFSGLPIVLFYRTIQDARGYSDHFWAVPVWSDAVSFYMSELGLGPIALLGILGVAVSFGGKFGNQGQGRNITSEAPLTIWQATSISCLSGLPVIVMIAAKFVTHGFTDRYAIASMVGIPILLSYFLYRVTPQRKAAVVAVFICLGIFGFQVHEFEDNFNYNQDFVTDDIAALTKTGNQQVAVMGITVFHRLSFYAPRELASRLTYVVDPATSIKYHGHDTIDRGLLELNPWFPIKVLSIKSFLESNKQFLSYGNPNRWTWLTFDLAQWGDTRLIERDANECLLFSVTNVRVPPDANSEIQTPEDRARMLYWKMPQTGPSLCERYMGPNSCPKQNAVHHY